MTHKCDRAHYYLCLLCYLDDMLCIHLDEDSIYFNVYIILSHLSWGMANQTCILVQSYIKPDCIM